MKTITVVTPTTGNPLIKKAINSVINQDYEYQIVHLIVADGEEAKEKLLDLKIDNLLYTGDSYTKSRIMVLPWNTGHDGFNGHRIYGAASFLIETDFICFLDEDNWFARNHISNFLNYVNNHPNVEWGYSFRQIVDSQGRYVCLDNCESLGHHPTCLKNDDYLIDVGCYFLNRRLAVQLSPIWFRKARPEGMLEVDREMAKYLIFNNKNYYKTCDYTLIYRVASRSDSVQSEFFLRGNKLMELQYPNGYPWVNLNDRTETLSIQIG